MASRFPDQIFREGAITSFVQCDFAVKGSAKKNLSKKAHKHGLGGQTNRGMPQCKRGESKRRKGVVLTMMWFSNMVFLWFPWFPCFWRFPWNIGICSILKGGRFPNFIPWFSWFPWFSWLPKNEPSPSYATPFLALRENDSLPHGYRGRTWCILGISPACSMGVWPSVFVLFGVFSFASWDTKPLHPSPDFLWWHLCRPNLNYDGAH